MRSYQHHIGDFNNATRHLNRVQRSIYRDLIELYYDLERQLPDDLGWISRKIIANDCSADVEQMLIEFFIKTPEGWYHDRCEHEIEKFRSSTTQKALAGKASAAKRAEKRQQAINGRSTDVQNHKPITSNQEPVTNNIFAKDANAPSRISVSDEVNEVFNYWREVMNHPKAKIDDKRRKLIDKAMKLGYSKDDLIAAINGCLKSPYHMGQNDSGTVYDDLGLILRDAGKIDGFIKKNVLPTKQQGEYHENIKDSDRVRRLEKSAVGRVRLAAERELEQIKAARQGVDCLPLDYHD